MDRQHDDDRIPMLLLLEDGTTSTVSMTGRMPKADAMAFVAQLTGCPSPSVAVLGIPVSESWVFHGRLSGSPSLLVGTQVLFGPLVFFGGLDDEGNILGLDDAQARIAQGCCARSMATRRAMGRAAWMAMGEHYRAQDATCRDAAHGKL